MAERPHTEILILDSSELPNAQALAAERGARTELVPNRGIEPVTTVTLLLIGPALAVGAVRQALEQRRGGQVIDLRPGAPKTFYRTADLTYGLIVVVTSDGKVTVQTSDTGKVFNKLISTLPMLMTDGNIGAKEAARVLAAALGPDAEVAATEE